MSREGEDPRLREENLRLRRAVEELSTLNDLARAIGSSFSSQLVIDEIIGRSVRAVGAEQASITLLGQQQAGGAQTLARAMGTLSEREAFHLDQALLGWLSLNKQPMLSNHPQDDERLAGARSDDSVHSLLSVPLMIKSELIGALTAYNKKDGGFSIEDQRLLAIIASQSAQVIENARLHEDEKALLRMQEEMSMARRIQQRLLPKEPPEIPGYDVAGISLPAREVGGDYFDWADIGEGRWAVCLGDVQGKGMPAALLMANLQATFHLQALGGLGVCDSVSQANRMLHRSTETGVFTTFVYGILDTQSHRVDYCNAGHEPPVLIRSAGGQDRLGTGNLVLGILADWDYKGGFVDLAPGECVVAYTDGVTEAEDEMDRPFGEDGLLALLAGARNLEAKDILSRIVDAVREHSAGAPQHDDITVLVLRRRPE